MSGYWAEEWRAWVAVGAWLIAGVWVWRASELLRRLPEVPDLTQPEWDFGPGQTPNLAVIVPARDEGENIRATLETLTQQEYPWLKVIVVDDRSTDATGAIADEFAARYPETVEAVHITELPEGWLGKTWALEVGCQRVRDAEYWLFTDADILFSPSVLWRAVGFAEVAQADHLVIMPTPIIKSRGEGMVLGFFQMLGLWAVRLWRVSDPLAKHDVLGVGAFNLVRRDTFEELGGFAPQRLVVLEDVTVGRRMKAWRKNQQVAFAPGMVLVHWAPTLLGVIRVMTKNLFSTVNFRPVLMLAGALWIALFFLAPLAGVFWWWTMAPSLLVLMCIAVYYRELSVGSEIDARYGWAYPVGALALIWAMLRSMAVVLWRGGVVWRGTFYPLRELRAHNNPFVWEREAAALRDRVRRERPSKLRRWVDSMKR